jgi:hypothetical protein
MDGVVLNATSRFVVEISLQSLQCHVGEADWKELKKILTAGDLISLKLSIFFDLH